jgi:hypothetical protein
METIGKKYAGVTATLHAFLTSALKGREWSAPRQSLFTLRRKSRDQLHKRQGGLGGRQYAWTKNLWALLEIEPLSYGPQYSYYY